MKKLKDKYRASDFGMVVVHYHRNPVTVRVEGSKNQHKDNRRMYFYQGNKKLGNCNPVFFKAHFVKAN